MAALFLNSNGLTDHLLPTRKSGPRDPTTRLAHRHGPNTAQGGPHSACCVSQEHPMDSFSSPCAVNKYSPCCLPPNARMDACSYAVARPRPMCTDPPSSMHTTPPAHLRLPPHIAASPDALHQPARNSDVATAVTIVMSLSLPRPQAHSCLHPALVRTLSRSQQRHGGAVTTALSLSRPHSPWPLPSPPTHHCARNSEICRALKIPN